MFRGVICIHFVYLYVNGSGSITCVREERANLSAVVYLLLCGFCLERFPLPLGAWDGLRCFIVALLEPSIYLFYGNSNKAQKELNQHVNFEMFKITVGYFGEI